LTVAAGTAARFAWAAPVISAGVLGSSCLFTCTITKLGNIGTVTDTITPAKSAGTAYTSATATATR
jgi:hypothetical protein